MSNTILYFVICVVLLSDSSDSLQCYDCTSSLGRDSPCAKDISGSSVASSFCYTGTCITYVIDGFVKRRCGSPLECTSMEYSPKYVSCESCQGDLCNKNAVTGGGGIAVKAPQLSLFVAAIVLSKRILS